MAVDTGNGASYTFSGVTVAATRMEVGEQTVGTLDTSVLSSAGPFTAKTAADLGDAGQVVIRHLFDPTDADQMPAVKTSGTLTITFDQVSTTNTAANLSGTAAIVAVKAPDFANNELLEGAVTFEWTDTAGPTFTEEQ